MPGGGRVEQQIAIKTGRCRLDLMVKERRPMDSWEDDKKNQSSFKIWAYVEQYSQNRD